MFLTQETELMRFRLLTGPHEETEQMIARYPEHLPLEKVVIPTVTELEERERKGEVVSEADKLLSEEIEVYLIMTIKQEEPSVKDEKKSDKNQKESEGSSSRSKSGSAAKEPNRRDYYKVCRECTDFVASYPVYHWHALEGEVHRGSGSCSTSRSDS